MITNQKSFNALNPNMNKRRMLALADRIEKMPHAPNYDDKEGFGMGDFYHACGSPSCMSGHAIELWCKERTSSFTQDAAKVLGLDHDFAKVKLFMPTFQQDYKSITPQQAAQALRNVVNGAITIEKIWNDLT